MIRLTKKRIVLIGSLIVADCIYFGSLQPLSGPTLILIGGFLLLAINVFLLFWGVLRASRALWGRPRRNMRRLSLIATILAMLLLALQSIGQLSVRDFLAALVLIAICYFYSSYYRFGHRPSAVNH